MLNTTQFPNNLVQQYLQTSSKLKAFERRVFKRLAPNVAEVSSEFNTLAKKFDDAGMPQYAAMCYLGASKCERSLANNVTEVDYLLKSARAFVKANHDIEKLNLRSNNREYIEGALKSYTEALGKLENDSAMKAAVIREIKKIKPNYENFSAFASPCHRIYDLELTACENIQNKDFVSALEKLTEIFDNVTERKSINLYLDVMNRIEVTRLLLLLILKLPPSRQSPSHIKLLEKYTNVNDDIFSTDHVANTSLFQIPMDLQLNLQDLALSCNENDSKGVLLAIEEMLRLGGLTKEQRILIDELVIIYQK